MFPAGFEERMQRLLQSEYPAFLASYDRPRNTGLRLNPLKTDTPPDLSRFSLTPVPWEPMGFSYAAGRPGLSVYHECGLYYLQEPSAMAPAALLDPQPGEKILDLCAAPGGKSTQIAGRMQGRGLLVCNEIHPKRAQILSSNIERLGIANALVLNEHPARLEARFSRYFDRILVDAPCSGEGMFRKEEAAVTDWSEETVAMCAQRQREILESACRMLRPGGRLVYSTCTFSPQENEGVLAAFLAQHPEFTVEHCELPYFAPGRPDWAEPFDARLTDAFRLWPHRLPGEGHFAAVLRSTEDGAAAADTERPAKLPAEFDGFRRSIGAAVPEGMPVLFGSRLFLAPAELPPLRGLKVLRAGLELGEVLKNRFEPAHAWALWLKSCESAASFPEDSGELRRYLAGESLPGSQTGWTLIEADGLSLGWAKGSGGQLKNHYPKALRRPLVSP